MDTRLDPKTMREFLDSLAMAVLDKDARYIYVSPPWTELVGVSYEDAIGKYVWECVPDTHAREVYQTKKPLSTRVVQTHGVSTFTSYIPRLDEKGEMIGLFLYVAIGGLEEAQALAKRIDDLSSRVEYYQKELSRERGARYGLEHIIGETEVMYQLRERIAQAARSTSTVLIEGETGTGKELIAHAIHAASARSEGNFVRVNCSAIPAELMESEFFGYAAGAFTGASKKGKIGRFELASGGSIFLDEINLLPSTMQPKFLRVLQEHEIDPVGGDKSIPIDARVIAASNIPLETLVEAGDFRSDLYFRLNVICIQAPPLRERKGDMPLLVDNFISRLNGQLGMAIEGIAPTAMDLLNEYDWPGNVRELQNAVESAMNITNGPTLRRKDFWQLERRMKSRRRQPSGADFRLRPARQAFEREFIRDVLAAADGNRAKAAKLLGISRTVLYERMEQYGLK